MKAHLERRAMEMRLRGDSTAATRRTAARVSGWRGWRYRQWLRLQSEAAIAAETAKLGRPVMMFDLIDWRH